MIDREKLIRGLQNRINESRNHGGIAVSVALSTLSGVLVLLKEQEPITPHVEHDSDDDTWYYGCGACHMDIDPKDKYCRHCGRQVLWDG